MEATIHPQVFKALMERQKLTQQGLADLSSVGIATIKRICSGKDSPKGKRSHTLKALAKALRVEVDILTACELPPSEEDEHLKSYVTIKAPVSRQTDLSFQAVEAMYGISRSAQIAMAPLFAALIAEASLKWRKERLQALGAIADQLDAIRGDNPLLQGSFARAWGAEKIEKQSIESKDVFGHSALKRLEEESQLASSDFDSNYDYDLDARLPYEWVSPFLVFLKDYAGSFAQPDIKIELGDDEGNPQIPSGIADYRIGADFIDEICGDNKWARIAIEFGHVSLRDIPKELLSPERASERQAYLASQMTDEKRWEHAKSRIEEHMAYLEARRLARLEAGMDQDDNEADASLFGNGPFEVTDELIRHEIKIIDEWGL
ncbi:helix-turn-helix domain-containing protein [Novosphingobium arvoryzae]|uniref:HTH cro/C1-type domain-containing protein n=1 Tax=Novosphingobium arvoryzae TaxID=1256514 RepID=A0A918RPN7_9SPHN|nr:helix-turn-helix transcriptional regulator [Novosphingobium arvoryzae]GHA07424.1 hypothetical protein GCM10011617_30110 [Novosphingobium arvoryzae]